MGANDRTVSSVLQDIVGNVQEIVRSEVRLAKTELKEEAVKAKSSGIFLSAGALTGLYAVGFLLLGLVYALSTVIPAWAAAFLVGIALAIVASTLLSTGRKRLKQVNPTPERTVETVKENVAWVKQQTR